MAKKYLVGFTDYEGKVMEVILDVNIKTSIMTSYIADDGRPVRYVFYDVPYENKASYKPFPGLSKVSNILSVLLLYTNIPEVAVYLNKSERTIANWRDERCFPDLDRDAHVKDKLKVIFTRIRSGEVENLVKEICSETGRRGGKSRSDAIVKVVYPEFSLNQFS